MTGCWIWTRSTNRNGYGRIVRWIGGKAKTFLVHRLVFVALVGPIPKGAVLGHLCRNRRCANPDHLDLTTVKANTRRGMGPTAKRWRNAQ